MRRALASPTAARLWLAASALSTTLFACSYDFDQFESATAGGAPSDAGSPPAMMAGRGGSTAGTPTATGGGKSSGGKSSGGAEPVAGSSAGQVTNEGGAGGSSSGFDCDAVSGTTASGHCYFVVGGEAGFTWADAQAACEGYSAHLLVVTSSAEESLVEKAFFPASSDLWLGLSLADTTTQPPPKSCSSSTCPFQWSSGEAVAYTNWDRHLVSTDEPNYSGACTRSLGKDAKWADLDCATLLPGLCEHD